MMIDDVDEFIEYAVEIPGRGYATWGCGVTPEPEWWTTNIREANEIAISMQGSYMRLGCAELAVAVRLVSRTATINRTAFSAYLSEPCTMNTVG